MHDAERPSAMSPLTRLPPELLLRMSAHLNTIDLGSLRRTCKQVEQGLFDNFAKEFFSKRQFMLEEHSLQALVDISAHPTLASYLTFVIISAEKLGHRDSREHVLRTGITKPETLLWTGQASALMVQAFRNLPNLRTVGLRNYAGPGRSRDGEGSKWRSYGWTLGRTSVDIAAIKSNPDARFHDGLVSDHTSGTTFPMLVHALASSGAKPKAIEVILYRNQGLESSSFNVLDGHLRAEIRDLLSQLQSLHMGVPLFGRDSDVSRSTFESSGPARQEILAMLPLQRFLQAATSLKSLRLNMSYRGMWANELIGWIGGRIGSIPSANAEQMTLSMPTVDFTQLESLEFGFCQVRALNLVQALTRFPQLRHFSLFKVALIGPDDLSSLQRRVRNVSEVRKQYAAVWSGFLRELARKLAPSSKITSAMIGGALVGEFSIDGDSEQRKTIQWLAPGATEESMSLDSKLDSIQYKPSYGFSISDWLVKMADRVYAPLPDLEDGMEEDDSSEDSWEDEE